MMRTPTFPRLPLVPDPLRRIHVPRDLDQVTTTGVEDAGAGGVDPAAIEEIWDATRDLYRAGVHPAIQLCVRRNGVVVLDRAIGHGWGNGPADGPGVDKVLATTETPFCVYSAAKGVTATVVHMLDERGVLRLEDRISDHIPEFARHGKGDITIAHVLSHRAGVPYLPKGLMDLDRLGDREFLVERLSDMKPASKPGTQLAYHAITLGFILGEVVERATGKSIREVLAEEILDPLGFRWMNYGVAPEDVAKVAPGYVTGPPILPPLSHLAKRVLSVSPDRAVAASNEPRFLTSVLPGSNTIATANELSRFFEILRAGGELDGVRVLQPATIRHAISQQSHLEPDRALFGLPVRGNPLKP